MLVSVSPVVSVYRCEHALASPVACVGPSVSPWGVDEASALVLYLRDGCVHSPLGPRQARELHVCVVFLGPLAPAQADRRDHEIEAVLADRHAHVLGSASGDTQGLWLALPKRGGGGLAESVVLCDQSSDLSRLARPTHPRDVGLLDNLRSGASAE